MNIKDPMMARAFIAECLVSGVEVRGLHRLMNDQEWVTAAIQTWKTLCEKACGDKIIKFPVKKKTLYSVHK
jgi:hypothetical protein